MTPTLTHRRAHTFCTLQDLGLPYEVSAIHIAEPDAREMLVLLLYLYQVRALQRPTIL